MSTQNSGGGAASQIAVADLAEAAIRGAERAMSARPPGSRFGDRITVGVFFDHARVEPSFSSGSGAGPGPRLTHLRTGLPISREATGRLGDLISKDRDLGRELARSLCEDFPGTLGQLFELTPEQREAAVTAFRDDRPSIALIGKLLADLFEVEGDVSFALQIEEPALRTRDDGRKFQWGLDVDIKGDRTGVSGGIKLSIRW
jgi:hypothetical protein